MSRKTFPGHPLFDTAKLLDGQIESLEDYPTLVQFLDAQHPQAREDWHAAANFLTKHAATPGSFAQFRGEVQRLLNFTWCIRGKSLKDLNGDDIDAYINLIKRPPKGWSTTPEQGRLRGFITRAGRREANPDWRPFYDAGKVRKQSTIDAAVASMSIFFKRLTVSGYLSRSPMLEATKRVQKASKAERASRSPTAPKARKATAPRLTSDQWRHLHDTLIQAADKDDYYEVNLFIVVTMKVLYLRVFELAPHGDPDSEQFVAPTMGDFQITTLGNNRYWELNVSGKGDKDRAIPLPKAYIPYLKRYREYRGLPPMPSPGETAPLIAKRGKSDPVMSKRTIERIVEESMVLAANRYLDMGMPEASEELLQTSKKTHILRHTGASMDIIENGRPLRDVSEDLGHESAAFTEAEYIDADTAKRYESGYVRGIL